MQRHLLLDAHAVEGLGKAMRVEFSEAVIAQVTGPANFHLSFAVSPAPEGFAAWEDTEELRSKSPRLDRPLRGMGVHQGGVFNLHATARSNFEGRKGLFERGRGWLEQLAATYATCEPP